MRETELMLLVFYKHKEITHPAAFVQEVLDLWEQDGWEPFRLYNRFAPASEITRELLETRLVFGEGDKKEAPKILRLKTSLKRDKIEASFIFSHPSCNPRLKPRNGGSSIGIDIPLSKTKKEPYQFQAIIEFYASLFPDRQVRDAKVSIISQVEQEEGIYQTLFDMVNYTHEKEYIIPCRRLDWVSFFLMEELAVIRKRFARLYGGFDSFCESRDLYVKPLERSNGALLCMKREPEDTPEFFYQIMQNNQDFWQAMKR